MTYIIQYIFLGKAIRTEKREELPYEVTIRIPEEVTQSAISSVTKGKEPPILKFYDLVFIRTREYDHNVVEFHFAGVRP